MTDSEIAAELNRRSWRCSVNHDPFTSRVVMILRWTYKLTSRADRLRAKGLLDTHQLAELIGTKHGATCGAQPEAIRLRRWADTKVS
jgi:hypothetical protein